MDELLADLPVEDDGGHHAVALLQHLQTVEFSAAEALRRGYHTLAGRTGGMFAVRRQLWLSAWSRERLWSRAVDAAADFRRADWSVLYRFQV